MSRPTTPYYGLILVRESDQDWGADLNRVVSDTTKLLALNQKPSNVNIRWGDIAGGKYLECNASGLQLRGDVNYSLGLAKNFCFNRGTSFPADFTDGVPFLRTDTSTMYVRISGAWVALSTITAGAIQGAGGLIRADLGSGVGDLGNFGVYNPAGGVYVFTPASNQGRVLVADSGQAGGWRWRLPHEAVAIAFAGKGSLQLGSGASAGTFLDLPVDATLRFLRRNDAAPGGLEWVSDLSGLTRVFTAKGQLLVSSASEAGDLLGAPTLGQILIGDPGTTLGVRWGNQSELGAVPGAAQTNAANIFAANNFF